MLFVSMLVVAFVVGGLSMKTMSESGNRPLSTGSGVAIVAAVCVAMLISFVRWGSGA